MLRFLAMFVVMLAAVVLAAPGESAAHDQVCAQGFVVRQNGPYDLGVRGQARVQGRRLSTAELAVRAALGLPLRLNFKARNRPAFNARGQAVFEFSFVDRFGRRVFVDQFGRQFVRTPSGRFRRIR